MSEDWAAACALGNNSTACYWDCFSYRSNPLEYKYIMNLAEPVLYLPLLAYTLFTYRGKIRGINMCLLVSWSIEAVGGATLFLLMTQ